MDIEQLYRDGYTLLNLPTQYPAAFSALLSSEEWVPDPEGVFSSLPSWAVTSISPDLHVVEREKIAEAHLQESLPAGYRHLFERLAGDQQVFGDLLRISALRLTTAHAWDGAEDLTWHWDGYASGQFVLLMYLSRQDDWPVELGGTLSVGTRPLTNDLLRVDPESVELLDEFTPQFGRAVLLNNTNPRFVHKASPLRRPVERRTIMASLAFG